MGLLDGYACDRPWPCTYSMDHQTLPSSVVKGKNRESHSWQELIGCYFSSKTHNDNIITSLIYVAQNKFCWTCLSKTSGKKPLIAIKKIIKTVSSVGRKIVCISGERSRSERSDHKAFAPNPPHHAWTFTNRLRNDYSIFRSFTKKKFFLNLNGHCDYSGNFILGEDSGQRAGGV